MTISPNVYRISGSAAELLELEAALPSPELEDGRLSPAVHGCYRRRLGQHDGFRRLSERLISDLATSSGARGYIVVTLPSDTATDLRLATAVCSLVGHPFRLVTRWQLWQELGVDLDAEPHRFGGVGYNPHHIDVVNASDPPPLTCLFSVRTDPLGGGYTIVSNLQRAIKELGSLEAAELARPVFHEGQFYDLFGVGRELRRFAVITPLRNGMSQVRFTAKMIPSLPPGPGRAAMEVLEHRLVATQERFLLRPGHLLIVNNIVMTHGREALGGPQEKVPAHERRLVRQTYLHTRDTYGFGSHAV